MRLAGRLAALLLFLSAISVWAVSPLPAASGASYSELAFEQFLDFCLLNGRVDFRRAAQKEDLLESYLANAAAVPRETFEAWPREERIAFLLNFLNGWMLKTVLDRGPLENARGLEEGGRPALFGSSPTRREIEQKWLLDTFRDERICLALYRPAKGGPPLRRVYRAADLDRSLEEDVRAFVSDPRFNRIEPGRRKIYLSPIFKWHADRFILNYGGGPEEKAAERAVLSFVAHYAEPRKSDYLARGRYKVKYSDYDWSLDEP
ncbi:MAG: DUF547 domain-containing protein [Candidatus Omnitrophica bacterium]|nr:DUF547 domain-containing protein [Candidatus Omnitrophota bacterium]